MNESRSGQPPEGLVGADAEARGPREFFVWAAYAARAQFDPSQQWELFVEALWHQVDAGFGLTDDDPEAPAPGGREGFERQDDASDVLRDDE